MATQRATGIRQRPVDVNTKLVILRSAEDVLDDSASRLSDREAAGGAEEVRTTSSRPALLPPPQSSRSRCRTRIALRTACGVGATRRRSGWGCACCSNARDNLLQCRPVPARALGRDYRTPPSARSHFAAPFSGAWRPFLTPWSSPPFSQAHAVKPREPTVAGKGEDIPTPEVFAVPSYASDYKPVFHPPPNYLRGAHRAPSRCRVAASRRIAASGIHSVRCGPLTRSSAAAGYKSGAEVVEYDLDNEDEEWLAAYNSGQLRLPAERCAGCRWPGRTCALTALRRMELMLLKLETACAAAQAQARRPPADSCASARALF